MGAGRNSCQHIQHTSVNFSRISLSRHRIAAGKSHLFCDHRVNLVDSFLVSVKQFQKTCLSAGCPFGAQQFQRAEHIFQIFQIHQKFLGPQCGTFAHRRWLCRLEMCKRQCRLCFILLRKLSKLCDHIDQFLAHQFQCLSHHNDICVVTHIARGRSQMDNSLGFWALYAISIHMGHHIMTHLTLPLLCDLVIDILRMLF